MEQVLKTTNAEGKTVSVGHNCAQMDKFVPALMGVSSAILENVIFCHQDESLWPFSDQANLKKIFDEVFDTTKYTKALTELRQTHKKYKKYAQEFKTELQIKGKDFDAYNEMKAKIANYSKQIESIQEGIRNDRSSQNEKELELSEITRKERQLEVQQYQLNNMEGDLRNKKSEIRVLFQKLGIKSENPLDSEFTALGQRIEEEKELSNKERNILVKER